MPFLLSLCRRAAQVMAHNSVRQSTPGTFSMAFVTVPNMDVAKRISGHLVKHKLAACVNIIPGVTSVYEWEGKVEEDSELILMIKTATTKIDEVSEYIRKNHPYDVAEVISSKIENGNPPYLDWIAKTVLDPSSSEEKKTSSDQ